MLFDINGKKQTKIPRQPFFQQYRQVLNTPEYRGIITELHRIMDDAIAEGQRSGKGGIFTSSWVAGHDWTDTPFDPIYRACGENEVEAKFFYGLLVWDAVIQHGVDWVLHRMVSMTDKPIGLTYFEKK